MDRQNGSRRSQVRQAVPADRPWVAGMYDYYLGGTANSEIDRAAARTALEAMPEIRETAWANRGFLQRSVRAMAETWGIRQFIDLGAGLPTQRHAHEIAREVSSDCRIVYVDNDPRVIERGRTILASTPGTAVVWADIRDHHRVLTHPQTRRLINFTEPVGVLAVAVIQWIPAADDPFRLISEYVKPLASGSYLAMTIPTGENQGARITSGLRAVYGASATAGVSHPAVSHPAVSHTGISHTAVSHTRADAERFFTGLEIVPPYPGAPPAVTYAGVWGAEDPVEADDDSGRWVYAAVGRKP